jgi:hypothetical protein
MKDKLEERIRRKFDRFMETTDERVFKRIKQDIRLVLYNKRKIPMMTRKRLAIKN